MSRQYQSRALNPGGCPCQGTGAKAGRVTPISMARATRPSHTKFTMSSPLVDDFRKTVESAKFKFLKYCHKSVRSYFIEYAIWRKENPNFTLKAISEKPKNIELSIISSLELCQITTTLSLLLDSFIKVTHKKGVEKKKKKRK